MLLVIQEKHCDIRELSSNLSISISRVARNLDCWKALVLVLLYSASFITQVTSYGP